MVGKRVILGVLGAVIPIASAHAVSYKLDFIPMKFEEFVDKFVSDKANVAKYKEFHLRVLTKRQESDEKQQAALNGYLYRKALDFLQKNHADWYAALQLYITNPIITLNPKYDDIRMFIDTFLIRLGTLEEFRTKAAAPVQVAQQAPAGIMERMWSSVKSFASTVKNTTYGWLGFSQQTA